MNVQTIILKEFSFLDIYDLIQLVPNSDSQISEVIILNPSFTTVSNKINVQIIILKEFISRCLCNVYIGKTRVNSSASTFHGTV